MIEIYGAAFQLPSRTLLDFDGEVTRADLHMLLSSSLTWDGMDLKSSDESEEACECNWLVIIDGITHTCQTNDELKALLRIHTSSHYGVGKLI
jgi:hypothetical protein